MIEKVMEEQLEFFAYQTSKRGKSCCGDSYIIISEQDYTIIAIADGLGSGAQAKKASSSVIDVINRFHTDDVQSLINKCNDSMKVGRGAAVSIAKIYYSTSEVICASVGNVRFTTMSPSGKSTFPLPKAGFLSGRPLNYLIHRYPYVPDSLFLMNSDGIKIVPSRDLLYYKSCLQDLIHYVDKKNTYEDDATLVVGKIKQRKREFRKEIC